MTIARNRAPIPKTMRLLGKERRVKMRRALNRGEITMPAWNTAHGNAKLVIWIETDAYFPNTYRYSVFVEDPQIQRNRPKTVLWLAHSHTAFDLDELQRYVEVSIRDFEGSLQRYKNMPVALEIEYEKHLGRIMRETLASQGYEINSKTPAKARIGERRRFFALEAGYVPVQVECLAEPSDRIGRIRTYQT